MIQIIPEHCAYNVRTSEFDKFAYDLSCGMRFPTIRHFDKCRVGRASAVLLSLETLNGVQPVA